MIQFFLAVALTLIAATVESRGFVMSFDAFKDGQFFPWYLVWSFLLYSLGIIIDYGALGVLAKSKYYMPELLALIFFTATIIGIAFFSGQFVIWSLSEKIVAGLIVVGLGYLTYMKDHA